ncbi:peptidylprolyl isomerase [Thalassolituus sp. UBA3500]|uniref:peptidylprolyl isomerase n=1 Tax=Thalassolituus sp. UBA3500 TaxID=1947664 RepID=UPI000C0E1F86|nr:peptidylprolyl isomerase A [Oceanospirillaceae bacterium]
MRKFLMLALLALPVFSANAADKNAEESIHIGLNTSEGYIELALDKEKAPISVENFVTYVEEGHYDGTIFHRVIKNFMIQGGGFDASMNRKPTRAAIKNEAKNGLKNKRGTVAMARTASVDSATSQFFINVKDNSFLDHGVRDYGYAVFGEVVKGMDVVDKIAETRVGRRDQPANDIVINSAVVVEKEAKEAAAPLIEN